MPLDNSVVAQIKDRLSILDLVGQRVALRKAGRNFQGLCPFHSEKTPSFVVFPDKGNFHCFGCGANGDIFTFVMRTENVDFAEALRLLAERADVPLRSRQAQSAVEARRQRLIEINTTAALFFQSMLWQEVGRSALEYLRRRGLEDKTLSGYQIGFAPDAWEALTGYLRGRNYDPAELVAAGVASQRDDGSIYDRFRGRIVFPIRDDKGTILGFGARALGDAQPKYLNSPETAIFTKGSCLYGIDVARGAIREEGRAIVVEGYVDVLTAHQHGIKNVVASLGTALTERQVALLKRLTKSVVLALDPDPAGVEAARRGLDVARQVYAEVTPVPTWRGLVRYEQKLGADLRIATLPAGRDPDEIIRESTDEWQRIVDGARPVVEYYLETTVAAADLASAKGKSAVAERVLPVIAEIRDPVQQAHYLGHLSRILGIREEALASSMKRAPFIRRTDRSFADVVEADVEARRPRSLDEYLIGLLLKYEELAPLVWDADPSELQVVEAREALRELQLHAGQYAQIDPTVYRSELVEPIAEWVDGVLKWFDELPPLPASQRHHELTRCINEIRRANLREEVSRVSQILADADGSSNDADVRPLLSRISKLLAALIEFERDRTHPLVRNWRDLVRQHVEADDENGVVEPVSG